MGFESTSAGVAASIYLALYTIYLLLVINVVRHKGFHFLYRILLLFGLFRVSGQFAVLHLGFWGLSTGIGLLHIWFLLQKGIFR